MISAELYKVFIKQRLIFFFIALLVLNFVYQIFVGYDTTEVIRNSEAYYTSFFDKYGGEITEEKSSLIKTEYESIEKDTGETLANSLEKQAFESFYHVYLYEVDSGSGYLSDTRGWETILCHSNINYFLVIFSVLLGVILFGTEYENEMDVMIVSTCGRNRLTGCKILIGIAVEMIAAMIFQMIQIGYLVVTIGLKNSSYPLNTIEFFENTAYRITLGEALLIKFFLNIVGGILLVCFVMMLTVLIKKREICMVLAVLSVMLPTMIFSESSILFRIPWCSSLLSASGFLWPDQYTYILTDAGNEKVLSFQAIGKYEMFFVFLLDALLIVLFSVVTFLRFSHYSMKSRRKKKLEILAVILMCLCFTGCGRNVEREEVTIDGTLNGQISVTKDTYEYYVDTEEDVVYRADDQENTIAITRNVFPLQQDITNIYVDSNSCYYLLESDSDSNFMVRCVDLASFEDTLIYSTGSKNTEDFYGLVSDGSEDAEEVLENMDTVTWFFVTEDSIYYQKGSAIYRCLIRSGKEVIVDDAVSDGEIQYKDGVLYYMDEQGEEASYVE